MVRRPEKVGDREVYPAIWIVLGWMAAGYILWRLLGHPAVPACWLYSRHHVYCPGCGGTRSVIALAHGRLLRSLYYHPAVLFTAGSVLFYLLSQAVWRLRRRRGWVLHYRSQWLWWLLILLALNCAVRNALWFLLGIPL